MSKSLNQDAESVALSLEIKSNPRNFISPSSLTLHYCAAIYGEWRVEWNALFVMVFLSSGLRNIFCLSFFHPRAKI